MSDVVSKIKDNFNGEIMLDEPMSGHTSLKIGGPVEVGSGFILYTADYQANSQLEVSSTVCLSSDPQILRDIAENKGPNHYMFMLGYAGWGPGQLENELTDNGWLTLPAEDEVIFNTPDSEKWRIAAQKFGIDITTFGDVVGSA